MDFLSGKKTYLVAGVAALVTFVYMTGFLDEPSYKAIMGFLTAGGLAALRAGIDKG